MPKFFVKSNQIEENKIKIIGNDVNHIKNVLRKQVDDQIEICDFETKKNFNCKIKLIDENFIICDIIEMNENCCESNIEITIYQGLPKADKMELIIQKSVELGVKEIVPVKMKRCIVKLEGKDEIKKIERWRKISEVAAKQCQRDIIPEIQNITTIKEISKNSKNYDALIVAYENEKQYSLKECLKSIVKKNVLKIALVIGPEGGLDSEEIELLKENGAEVVTLGKRILRTETVALNVASIIMYELEN